MSDKHYYVGIDVGSRTTKAVIWNGEHIIGKSLIPTGWTPEASARTVYEKALNDVTPPLSPPTSYGGKELSSSSPTLQRGKYRIVATGYGRVTVPFADKTITEITAHARGVSHQVPDAKTLIDIGGQDSKAIVIDSGDIVADFAMNDRCAAGSGKFLEFLAASLDMSIQEFAEVAYSSTNPIAISSICTVFAETELLSMLAEGIPREDIAAGVHRSIAVRVGQLARSLHPQPPVAFSGGVAYNRCLIRELSRVMGHPISVSELPEYCGALGAALIAESL